MARPKQRSAEADDEGHPHLREVAPEPHDETSSVAAELSRARQARGIDLHDAARELRIRHEHLGALEERRFEELPGPTYVIGFLRSYAAYLGLDAQDLVARFKAETSAFGARQKLDFPSPADEGRLPRWPLLLIALALAIAVYAVWYYLGTTDRLAFDKVSEIPASLAAQVATPGPPEPAEPAQTPAATEVATKTPTTPATEVTTKTPTTPAGELGAAGSALAAATTQRSAAAPQAPSPAPPPAPSAAASTGASAPGVLGHGDPGSGIVLRATLESWVRVTGPDNELLLEKFLRPGDVYTVPDRFGLLLTTGNAGGLEITVEGRVAPALGPIGAVRRNVVLDSEKLLAGTALTP